MTATEIVLLAAGVVIFILSFLLPDRGDKRQAKTAARIAREEVKALVDSEMDAVKVQMDEAVSDTVTSAMEKTERSMERLSNEKIMAINEYSDTVLSEIHKNHEEAMFLYDMLNNKHTNLKNTVSEVNRTVKVAEETVNTFRKLSPESDVSAPISGNKTEAVQEPLTGLQLLSASKMAAAARRSAAPPQEISPRREPAAPREVPQREPAAPPREIPPRQEPAALRETPVRQTPVSPQEVSVQRTAVTPREIPVRQPVSSPQALSARQASVSPQEPPVRRESAVSGKTPAAGTAAKRSTARPKAAFVRTAEEQIAKETGIILSELAEADEMSENGNSNVQILRLYNRGMDQVNIAKELGLGVGEVKLVIDLFDSQKQEK